MRKTWLVFILVFTASVIAPILVYATTKNQSIYDIVSLTISASISSLNQYVYDVATLSTSASISGLNQYAYDIISLTISGSLSSQPHLHNTITLTIQVGTIPVNGAFTISNADDTNNLYAQYRDYSITSVSTISGGYAEISTVTLHFYQGSSLVASILYNEDTDTFSQTLGAASFVYVADGSGAVRSGTTITLTVKFRVKWAASSGGLILRQALLGQGGLTDDDYDPTHIYDVETKLRLVSLAGSVHDSTHFVYTGSVTYCGSSLYPGDDEFTKIHLHNAAHVSQANEDVHDGAFSLEKDLGSTPGAANYHLYLNMADADYVDADLPGGLVASIILSGGGGSVTLNVDGDAVIVLDGAPVTTPDSFTFDAGETHNITASDIPSLGVTLDITGDADIHFDGGQVTTPDSFALADGSTHTVNALDIPGGGGTQSAAWLLLILIIIIPLGLILSRRR